MALRASASAVGTALSDTVTVNDPGSVAGDQLSLFVIVGGNQVRTLSSVPPGFTQIATGIVRGANHGITDCWFAYYAGTTVAASYSVTVQGANQTTPIIAFAANSGRSTAANPSNFKVTTDTNGTNGGASPVTVTLSGLVAKNNDDVLFCAFLNANASPWSFTSPSGFTNQQTQSVHPSNNDDCAINLQNKDNIASGTTGNFVSTATGTGASNGADYGGIIVSLPALIVQSDSANAGISGNGPGTVTANNACAIGDLLLCQFNLLNVTSGNSGFVPVISDSVNSGNWAVQYSFYDSAGSAIKGFAYKVANSSGTPTVTLGGSTAYSVGNMSYIRLSGWQQTPTFDGPVQSNTAVSSNAPTGSFTSRGVNEAVLAMTWGGGSYTTPPSGAWDIIFNASGGSLVSPYWQFQSNAASNSFTGGQLSASTTWFTALFGFSSGPPTAQLGWVPVAGPGVSPDKRQMFTPVQLASSIPPQLNFVTGYSSAYGFGQLLPLSNLQARGFSNSYGFALMFRYGLPTPWIPQRAPGISADWPQAFIDRNLSTQSQQTPAGVILANGYSSAYGFINAGNLGQILANGYSGAYARGLMLGAGALKGTGYSDAYGFGSLAVFVLGANAYSSSYGFAAGPGIIIMPNVLQDIANNAIAILQSLGLNVIVGQVYSTLTPAGLVSAQNPNPGTVLSVGATVEIFVSLGQFVRAANPQLGYKVSSRVFSLEEMVSREWGPDFRAPDHRIYVWSNNRAFDSTDLGITGIYNKGTGDKGS